MRVSPALLVYNENIVTYACIIKKDKQNQIFISVLGTETSEKQLPMNSPTSAEGPDHPSFPRDRPSEPDPPESHFPRLKSPWVLFAGK